MNDFDMIIERMRANEETARRFFEIESKILTVLNFKDLFEVLLTEIQNTFQIPYVWISLIEKSEISGLLKTLETSEILRERINIIDNDQFKEFVGSGARPRLVNSKLKPYFQLFPPRRKFFIKSLAIIPISLDGELIGSLNQADSLSTRFQPGIDTSLLEKLALKVSLCLSNVTAHEKLKLLTSGHSPNGLLTRSGFKRVLKRELSRCNRYKRFFSIVILDFFDESSPGDLKEFQMDQIIDLACENIRYICRSGDIAGRYDKNNIIILLPETSEQEASHLIERLRGHFKAQLVKNQSQPFPVLFNHHTICISGDKDTEFDDIKDWIKIVTKRNEKKN